MIKLKFEGERLIDLFLIPGIIRTLDAEMVYLTSDQISSLGTLYDHVLSNKIYLSSLSDESFKTVSFDKVTEDTDYLFVQDCLSQSHPEFDRSLAAILGDEVKVISSNRVVSLISKESIPFIPVVFNEMVSESSRRFMITKSDLEGLNTIDDLLKVARYGKVLVKGSCRMSEENLTSIFNPICGYELLAFYCDIPCITSNYVNNKIERGYFSTNKDFQYNIIINSI